MTEKKLQQDLGETWQEWIKREREERKTRLGKIKYAWEDYIYNPIYRFSQRVRDLPEDVKAFWQRGRRGFADRDCWGVDNYLEEIIPAMLKTMMDEEKGGGNSYPGYDDDPNVDTIEHWHETVNKMIAAFDAWRRFSDEWIPMTSPEGKKLKKTIDEGMNLFVKYFPNLWD